jgi:hypothetical protein
MDPFEINVEPTYRHRGVHMTPARQLVADRMNADDEGLTPRAFACLLLLHDGRELSELDAEFLCASPGGEPLALLVDGKPALTELGKRLAALADMGAVDAIYALTTLPSNN